MTAIITKLIPATDNHGTRIKAQFGEPGWARKTLVLPYDYELSGHDNHVTAVAALLNLNQRPNCGWQYVGSGQTAPACFTHLIRITSV
jgi:hypothetical protein